MSAFRRTLIASPRAWRRAFAPCPPVGRRGKTGSPPGDRSIRTRSRHDAPCASCIAQPARLPTLQARFSAAADHGADSRALRERSPPSASVSVVRESQGPTLNTGRLHRSRAAQIARSRCPRAQASDNACFSTRPLRPHHRSRRPRHDWHRWLPGSSFSRLVYTAASLADHLASRAKSAGELATPTGCDAGSCGRSPTSASWRSVTMVASRSRLLASRSEAT